MEVLKISYPTSLDKIEDVIDNNIDVFIELDDRRNYTIVVSTDIFYFLCVMIIFTSTYN